MAEWAVVDTDNFGRDWPNEKFVGEPYASLEEAEQQADTLNTGDPNAPRFFKVVALPYELQPGFEP